MRKYAIARIAAAGCTLCLIATLMHADGVSGCEKPGRSRARGWAPWDLIECMSHIVDEVESFSGPCCDLGLCATRYARRGLMHQSRGMRAESIPTIIGTVIRCILTIIGQDEERYKTLNCCNYILWPFWCSR